MTAPQKPDMDAVETVFAYWKLVMGHPRAILDRARARKIHERLSENGGDLSELLYAIDGASKDKWIMGQDPNSTRRYDGIETIFRERSQIERFAETMRGYRDNAVHPQLREAPDVGGKDAVQ